MSLHLDTRKRIILNALLRSSDYLSSRELSNITGVTSRTVRTDLGYIADVLKDLGYTLLSSPGLGFMIPEEFRQELRDYIVREEGAGIKPVTPDERMYFLIGKLLNMPVSISDMQEELNISESTFEKDMERCGSWFAGLGLKLKREDYIIRLEDKTGVYEGAFIPYYLELSKHTGVKSGILLSEDFRLFSQVRSGLRAFLREHHLALSDYEYILCLIYMLVIIEKQGKRFQETPSEIVNGRLSGSLKRILLSEGVVISEAVSEEIIFRMESAGCFSPSDEVFGKVKERLSDLLNRLQYAEADDLLIEGIVKSVKTCGNTAVINAGQKVSIRDLEIRYPDALRLSIKFLSGLDELKPGAPVENEIIETGMCFAAFLERNPVKNRKRVSVICTEGPGTAQLISERLSRMFPNLEIVGVYPEYLLEEAEKAEPDFIISTAELDSCYDVVRIGSFMSDSDFDRIIPFFRRDERGREMFMRLVGKEYFFAEIDPGAPEQIIRRLCTSAFGNDCEDFIGEVLEREALGATAVGNLAAIPHAIRGDSGENRIAVGILKRPVRWGNENVQIVFLLRLDDPEDDTAVLFDYLYEFINNRGLMKRLIKEKEYALLFGGQEGEE